MNDQAQAMPLQMTSQQQAIERDVRLALGDMHLQLIMARARIAELEQHLAAKEPEAPPKPNGKDKPEMKAN